jgi:uncharacterized protein
METVLITGGSGLIGRHLCTLLKAKGYDVILLSRSKKANAKFESFYWDIEKKIIELAAIEKADYIIHLAGAGLADKRWSKKRKQEIVDSRVLSTELLFDKIKNRPHPLKAFISTSAIGYYGAISSDKIFTENDAPNCDFLGMVCQLWEQTADKFSEINIRTVKIRTGVVLTSKGGALAKMKMPVQLGLGSDLGSGKQYLPWIHIDDLCGIYLKAIKDKNMNGSYNAVAPEHITNHDATKTLAHTLHKPFFAPSIPAFLFKILYGKMADVLLKGSRVSSEKICKAGYRFLFPKYKQALTNLFID